MFELIYRFIDSDDLSDLRNLLDHVRDTKVLVLLQSKGVLTRPWVIMELYTAIKNGVPIVALNVQNANPYNYSDAVDFLMHFDTNIEVANPGAAELLIDLGVEPVDVAYLLSDSLPNIISTDFNPNASEKVLQASLEDLADSMRKAMPIAPTISKEEWLEKRKMHKRGSSGAKKEHGQSDAAAPGASTEAAKALAEIPATVPELPNAYLVRQEDIDQLKAALFSKDDSAGATLTSKKPTNKVGAHGMVSFRVYTHEERSNFIRLVATHPHNNTAHMSLDLNRGALAKPPLQQRFCMMARCGRRSRRLCGCRWGRSQTFATFKILSMSNSQVHASRRRRQRRRLSFKPYDQQRRRRAFCWCLMMYGIHSTRRA